MREDLKEIGLRLKWEQRTIQTRTLPSLEFMAKRTDLKREYNFLYHTTSRFSHFSVVELLRRAWGGRDKVSITSENIELTGVRLPFIGAFGF